MERAPLGRAGHKGREGGEFVSAAVIAGILFAYLLGSVPTGLLVGRLVGGIDVRRAGSGNIGATNVGRLLGMKWGVLVFLLDAGKGAAAVGLVAYGLPVSAKILCGLASILGHVFPLFLAFRGGRGVATACGVTLLLTPLPAAVSFGVWLLVLACTRYVSAASMSAAATLPPAVWLLDGRREVLLFASVAAVLVIGRHVPNIRRLAAGTEHRVSWGRREQT